MNLKLVFEYKIDDYPDPLPDEYMNESINYLPGLRKTASPFLISKDNIHSNVIGYMVKIKPIFINDQVLDENDQVLSDAKIIEYEFEFTSVIHDGDEISENIISINVNSSIYNDSLYRIDSDVLCDPYLLYSSDSDGPYPLIKYAKDSRFLFQPESKYSPLTDLSEANVNDLETTDFCFISKASMRYLFSDILNPEGSGEGTLIISGAKIHVGEAQSESGLVPNTDDGGFFTLKFETLPYRLNNSLYAKVDVRPNMIFADPCPPLWTLQAGDGNRMSQKGITNFKKFAESKTKSSRRIPNLER